MRFMTVDEIAVKWGITPRQVRSQFGHARLAEKAEAQMAQEEKGR